MPRSIEVEFEDGVLKPLSALKLREHEILLEDSNKPCDRKEKLCGNKE